MSRVLAVDWGTRRVGLAVSDPMGFLARPLPTARVGSAAQVVDVVDAAARQESADELLLGLPLHMEGDEGTSARRVRDLGAALSERGWTVRYRDERLTSEDALAWLRERGETRPEKTRVDQVAALLLLQGFLEDGETHA